MNDFGFLARCTETNLPEAVAVRLDEGQWIYSPENVTLALPAPRGEAVYASAEEARRVAVRDLGATLDSSMGPITPADAEIRPVATT